MPGIAGAARRRALLFGGISLLLAGGTAFLMHRIVSGYEERIAAVHQVAAEVSVVTAARALPAGTALVASDLAVVSVPADIAREGSTYAAIEDVVGQIPQDRILAGEILRTERLNGSPEESPLTAAVTEGWRAATIRVDKARGVGGLLRPGNRVDVIVTIRPDDNALGSNWVTETILQDATVLAVGAAIYGSAPEAAPSEDQDKAAEARGRWDLVTLEVLPEEAEKLALGASRGDLALALRRPGDDVLMENTGPTVTNALLGLATGSPERKPTRRRIAAPPPPTAPHKSVEVIQGSRTSVEHYDEEGHLLNEKVR